MSERGYDPDDTRALLKVVEMMIPVWEWQINLLPTSPEKDEALLALVNAQRELADRFPEDSSPFRT